MQYLENRPLSFAANFLQVNGSPTHGCIESVAYALAQERRDLLLLLNRKVNASH
jgi:hypothetical protein